VLPVGRRKSSYPEDPTRASFAALLDSDVIANQFVWLDDRCVQSLARKSSVRVVGILDVLRLLLDRGDIDKSYYFDCLFRLRLGNFAFLTLKSDEILHHLNNAHIDDGALMETPQLRTLRHQSAATLLKVELFETPATNSPDIGEHWYLLRFRREIAESLVATLCNQMDAMENCLVRAEWIFENMYISTVALAGLASLKRSDDQLRHMLAVEFSHTLAVAYGYFASANLDRNRRRQALEWLYWRITAPQFDADERLRETFIEQYKAMVAEIFNVSGADGAQIRYSLATFATDLPPVLRDSLLEDTGFCKLLGLRRVMNLGNLEFDRNEFNNAVGEIFNDRECKLKPTSDDNLASIELTEANGQYEIKISQSKLKEPILMPLRHAGIYSEHVEERKSYLEGLRRYFDCPNEEFSTAVTKIISFGTAAERVSILETKLANSTLLNYAELHSLLQSGRMPELRDFEPPSVGAVLGHLRITELERHNLENSSALLGRSADRLKEDAGLYEAFAVHFQLPVSLSECLLSAVDALSESEARDLIDRLQIDVHTPCTLAHAIYLAQRIALRLPQLTIDVSQMLERVTDVDELRAFIALLRFLGKESIRWKKFSSLDSRDKLLILWLHGGEIFKILRDVGVSVAWITENFADASDQLEMGLDELTNYWNDIAHPRNLSEVPLLLALAGYACGAIPQDQIAVSVKDKILAASLLRDTDTGNSFFQPSLLKCPALQSDRLGSFLSRDRGPLLGQFAEDQLGRQLTNETLLQYVEDSIEAIQTNLGDAVAWQMLGAIVGDSKLPEENVQRLLSALDKSDLAPVCIENTRIAPYIILVPAWQLRYMGDGDGHARHRDQLLALTRSVEQIGKFDDADGFKGGPDKLVMLILDAFLSLSNRSENSVANFADCVRQVFDLCPGQRAVIGKLARELCKRLPAERNQYFWPLWIRARGRL